MVGNTLLSIYFLCGIKKKNIQVASESGGEIQSTLDFYWSLPVVNCPSLSFHFYARQHLHEIPASNKIGVTHQ